MTYDLSTKHTTQHDPLWSWIPVVVLWVGFIIGVFVIYITDPTGFGLSAYEVYHQSALALVHGEAIYQGTAGWIYLYPPFLAQVFIPVAQTLSYDAAALLWLILNFAVLIGTVALLVRYIPAQYAKALWVGTVLFLPIGQALYIGQVTIIMLALLATAWVAIQEDHHDLAGGMIALAAWIKVFPGVLVLYFLWKRDWRIIRGVAIAGITILIFQVVVSGPDLMVEFFRTLFELTAQGQPDVTFENNSIFAFASRLFQENPHVQPVVVSSTLFTISRLLLTVTILGGAVVVIVRGRKLFDVEYGLVIITILLFGGTLWISGMPPLLLVYVLILRHYRRRQIVLWLALSFILITTFIPMMLVFLDESLPALILSTGFFGVLIIWGVLVFSRKPLNSE